ncbi:MAG: TonB-dependent hemoglobin/transferrin/lactoferrin family receptor [Moraxella sp.]|jgi:TonB-dependent hemoglobin/transferrin/lactoferrin receptor
MTADFLTHHFKPIPTALSLAIASVLIANHASASSSLTAVKVTTPETELENLMFTAIAAAPTTSHVVTKQTITEELIMNNHDLVRYNPEVSISDVGRYGAKGFAIQGVDGNRVAMVIDGLKVPEIEVNEFYVPYGYVNDGRFMSDVELLQSASILKGANAIEAGNGAIGGAVVYQTKAPDDLIQKGKNTGGYLKTGYTNKNQEYMTAIGVAGKNEQWSGLINYVHREGHELKNHAMRKFDAQRLAPFYEFPNNEKGASGIYPDPSHYEQQGATAKLYYSPTSEHRIGISGGFQYLINHNRPVTKTLYSGQNRHAFDENERRAVLANYRYQPSNNRWLSALDIDYGKQRITTVGDTYIYDKPNLVDRREYRPNYFDVDQVQLKAMTTPLIAPEKWQFLGEHIFNVAAQFSKNTYDPYSIYYSPTLNFEDNSALQLRTDNRTRSISVVDNVTFNDKVGLELGLRHDDYRLRSNMRESQRQHFEKIKHNFTNEQIEAGNISPMLKAYLQNDLELPQNKTATTWQAKLHYRPTARVELGYQAGTGFLMPLSNQAYAGFAMNGIAQVPNPRIQPEKSFSQQLSVRYQQPKTSLTLAGYHNRYLDFIDVKNYGCFSGYDCYQYVNIHKAHSQGVHLMGDYAMTDQLDLRAQLAWQQGNMGNGTDLLSIQPLNGLVSLNYHDINDKYQFTALARYLGRKKADTTKRINESDQSIKPLQLRTGDLSNPLQTSEDITQNTWVYDLYGNIKLNQNLSMQLGVYNIFDRQYIPWENIRPLATLGINSMVKGQGIDRYSAPGRNYALSLNYAF